MAASAPRSRARPISSISRSSAPGSGERFETLRIALKFYSCVASNHTSLDAIRAIQARRPFTLDQFAKIVIHGSQVTVDHVGWPYRPEGLTSAQLNLPFCVATLLLEGDVFVDQFKPAAFTDAARMELSRKVEVVHDPPITALGSKFRHKVSVEVHLKDGSIERKPASSRAAARTPSRQRRTSSRNSASLRARLAAGAAGRARRADLEHGRRTRPAAAARACG